MWRASRVLADRIGRHLRYLDNQTAEINIVNQGRVRAAARLPRSNVPRAYWLLAEYCSPQSAAGALYRRLVRAPIRMDNDKCRKLIQLYGANELMWNSKLPQYHNKLLRLQTWVEISKELNVPIPELKKKMTILLASYRREKCRIMKSLSSGRGEVYVSKWYGFEDFKFMKDKEIPYETLDPVVDNTHNDNDAETLAPEEKRGVAEPPKNPQRNENIEVFSPILREHLTRRKRKRSNTKDDSSEQEKSFHDVPEATTSTDLYFSYGQYIANELRKYDQHTLSYVKQAINNVIFKADIGKYSKLERDQNEEIYYSSTPSASPQPTSSPQSPDPLCTPKLEPKSSPIFTEDF